MINVWNAVNDGPVINRKQANGDIQRIGKMGKTISLSVSIRIFQDRNTVFTPSRFRRKGLFMRLGYPHPPPGVKRHIHRLTNVRFLGITHNFKCTEERRSGKEWSST